MAKAAPPPGGASASGQNQLGQVARSSSLNLIGALMSALSTTGITVLVTRAFPKETAGAFFAASSAYFIVKTLATLGANNGLVYFIARLRALGEDRRLQAIMRSAVLAVSFGSLLAMVALFILAEPLGGFLLGRGTGTNVPDSEVQAAANAVRVLALMVPFGALLDTLTGAARGYRQMRPTVLIDKIGRSAVQVLGVGVAAATGTAALIAPMWALPYVPAVALAWVWLQRIRRKPSKRPPDPGAVPPELAVLLAMATPLPGSVPILPSPTKREGSRTKKRQLANANPGGFWKFTVPRGLASVSQIIVQRLGIVLVSVYHGAQQAAMFTAASRLLVVGQLGNTALINAAQPRFTELFAQGDKHGANVVYRGTTAWLVLMTWPMFLLSLVFGPELLLVFGKSYKAGFGVMMILSTSMLVSMALGQVDMVLVTAGRSSWSLANGLMTVVGNIIADILLIPRYGITGAAIGWAVAIFISNVIPLFQLWITLGLHPFGRVSATACAICAVSYGAVPLAIRIALGDHLVGVVAGMAAGTAVFAAGLWWQRGPLQLASMPGVSAIQKRLKKRRAKQEPEEDYW
ncbi:MAG TPA: polysaccharide biosynthesis C-terminal domain-containing protein [Streptosporangiaceae bacterium]|nr:polysaccharide biosynthesis C-terminal domain-containing protein [Streptosporangiaceae bacterium]